MRSSKSRSRNKSNRQRSIGNIINRVFDSSGPEGKVRGTPQQIIEKYLALARDAQLGNDRVAEQNFLQHAEHYTRLLGEAQREMAREQEERQRSYQQNGNGGQNGQQGRERQDRFERDTPEERGETGGAPLGTVLPPDADDDAMPEAFLPVEDEGPGLVETPEMRAEVAPVVEPVSAAPAESAEAPAEAAPERKPRRRSPRKPAAPKAPKAEGAKDDAGEAKIANE